MRERTRVHVACWKMGRCPIEVLSEPPFARRHRGPVSGGCCSICLFPLRQMEQLLQLLTTEILHPDSDAPSGVKSHFIEIFLEELAKVGSHEVRRGAQGGRLSTRGLGRGADAASRPQLTADQNLRLIDPFCRIAAQTQE